MGFISVEDQKDVCWKEELPHGFPDDIFIYKIAIHRHLTDLSSLKNLLDEHELKKADRYFQDFHRDRFIVRRAVLRQILGRHTNQRPESIRFGYNASKKPYLLSNDHQVSFNVSYSNDYILIGVAPFAIGVDIEYLDPDFSFSAMLYESFGNEERTYITETNSVKRFFKLWTRKEAFFKGTGQGIDDRFKECPVLDGRHKLPSSFDNSNQDWYIKSFDITNNYQASVAYSNPNLHHHYINWTL